MASRSEVRLPHPERKHCGTSFVLLSYLFFFIIDKILFAFCITLLPNELTRNIRMDTLNSMKSV